MKKLALFISLVKAMELSFYKLIKLNWVETGTLTPYDVALIVDKSDKAIYFWYGAKASMKRKVEAKTMIGENKQKFPRYKYYIGNERIPDSVQESIQSKMVEESRLKRIRVEDIQKTRIAAKVLGAIGTGFLIWNFIFIASEFLREEIVYLGQLYYQIPSADYFNFLETIVILNISAFLFLMGSAIVFINNRDKWNIIGMAVAVSCSILTPLLFWNNYTQLFIVIFEEGFVFIRSDAYRLFLAYSLSLCGINAVVSLVATLYGAIARFEKDDILMNEK